jgi:hypothetical protein
MSAKTKAEMELEARKVREDTRGLRLRLLEQRAAQAQGPKGERGPRGLKGDKPAHEWQDTELRFENPDGSWGELVNLKGERGERGYAGASIVGPQGPQGIPGTGSGSGNGLLVPLHIAADEVFTVPANSQIPFMMTIDCEGILDVEGFLVAV